VSTAISDISGCTKSTDGSSLTIIGLANSQPFAFKMNPASPDGKPDTFTSIEYYATSKTVKPVYKTFGAAFLDNKDVNDGK